MDTKLRGLSILFFNLLFEFSEFVFRGLQPLFDRLLLRNKVEMSFLQVSERTAGYPELARTIEGVLLLTEYLCLFCLPLRNLGV